jgi:hypothetical protein
LTSATPRIQTGEAAEQTQARRILQQVSGSERLDLEDRIAAFQALDALDSLLPADVIRPAVDEQAGSLTDAEQLLAEALLAQTTARGITAIGLARRHLQKRIGRR